MLSQEVPLKINLGNDSNFVQYKDVELTIDDLCMSTVCGSGLGFEHNFKPAFAEDVQVYNSIISTESVINSNFENILVSSIEEVQGSVENIDIDAEGGHITGSFEADNKLLVRGLYKQFGNIAFTGTTIDVDSLDIKSPIDKTVVISSGKLSGDIILDLSTFERTILNDFNASGDSEITIRGNSLIQKFAAFDGIVEIKDSQVRTLNLSEGYIDLADSNINSLTVNQSSAVVETTVDAEERTEVSNVEVNSFSSLFVKDSELKDAKIENEGSLSLSKSKSSNIEIDFSDVDLSISTFIKSLIAEESNIGGRCLIEDSDIRKSQVSGSLELDPDVDGCKISDSEISEDSVVSSRVLSSVVTNFSKILDKAEVKESSMIDNSEIKGEVVVRGSNVRDKSVVSGSARLDGITFVNSTATNNAVVDTNKNNNTCDGIDDNDPEDPCISSVQQ